MCLWVKLYGITLCPQLMWTLHSCRNSVHCWGICISHWVQMNNWLASKTKSQCHQIFSWIFADFILKFVFLYKDGRILNQILFEPMMANINDSRPRSINRFWMLYNTQLIFVLVSMREAWQPRPIWFWCQKRYLNCDVTVWLNKEAYCQILWNAHRIAMPIKMKIHSTVTVWCVGLCADWWLFSARC